MGECFQWKAHGQCSKGYSCSFSHDKVVQGDLYGGHDIQDSGNRRQNRLTARDKIPHRANSVKIRQVSSGVSALQV